MFDVCYHSLVEVRTKSEVSECTRNLLENKKTKKQNKGNFELDNVESWHTHTYVYTHINTRTRTQTHTHSLPYASTHALKRRYIFTLERLKRKKESKKTMTRNKEKRKKKRGTE